MRSAILLCALCLTTMRLVAQRPASDTSAARAAFALGKRAVQAHHVEESVTQMERAVALDPGNWEYHMWLGHAYVRQIGTVNFMRKAFVGRRMGSEYNRAVELAPENVDAAEARLEFFLEAPGMVGGGLDKAQAEARRIAGLNPYRGGFAQARISEHEKQYPKTDSAYRALILAYPDSSAPVASLATMYQTTGRYADAFAIVDARLTRCPDDTSSIYQLGRIASVSGQELDRGEAALRRYLELLGSADPFRQANGHYRLGMIRERRGDLPTARAEYQRAVELNPGHEPAAQALKKLAGR
jgi:tetratricopeptide (TPR) repeat protein